MPKLTRMQIRNQSIEDMGRIERGYARELFSIWLRKGDQGNAWFVAWYKKMSLKKNGGGAYAERIRSYMTLEKNEHLAMVAYTNEILERHPDVLPGIQDFLPEKSQQRPTR